MDEAELLKCLQVLGLKPGCTVEDLEAAFEERASAWQPELFAHNEQLLAKARARLQHIQGAYHSIKAYLEEAQATPEPAPAPEPVSAPPPKPAPQPVLETQWPRRDPAVDAFPAEPPAPLARRLAVWVAWIVVVLLLAASAWLVFFRTDEPAPNSAPGTEPAPVETQASPTNSPSTNPPPVTTTNKVD